MRKIIIVAVVVLIAISAGAYIYFFQPFAEQAAITDVLPADTLVMVRVCELKRQIEAFRDGRMGQKLSGIDLPTLLTMMEVGPAQREVILQGLEDIKTAVESPWFDVLFGRDISIALLNGDYDLQIQHPQDLGVMLDAIVLVAQPRQPTHVLESLNAMLRTQSPVKTQPYRQWEIHEIPLKNGPSVYYALDQGLMIAGLAVGPVQRCLDQSLDPAASLSLAEAYQRYGADLLKPKGLELLAFANVEGGLALFDRIIDRQPFDANEVEMLRSQMVRMRGIQTIHMAHFDDGGELVRTKLIMGIDRRQMSPALLGATGIRPMDNPTLKYIPKDAMLYSWQNTVDLKLYWQEFQQSPGVTADDIAEVRRTVATQTGMDLETLIAAFGTQAGFLVNTINMNGMFPIPEIALFIETVDPDRVDGLIKAQVSQFNMPLMQETYNGTDLHYVALPLGDALSPAYTFSEGFCTLAINRNLLKAMLDAPDTDHLGDSPGFQSVDRGLSDANNNIFYMDTQRLLTATRELIGRSLTWMALAKPDGVQKARQIAELGIYPLLDGMATMRAVGGRTTMADDHIRSDVLMLLDRP